MMDGGETHKDTNNIFLIQNSEQLKVVSPWSGQQIQEFQELFLPNGRVSSSLQWDKNKYLSAEVGIYDQKHFTTNTVIIWEEYQLFISVMILLIFIPKRIIFSS